MATPAPALPVQPETHLGFPARLMGVVFSPTATFNDIVRKPSFLAPVILLTILVVANSAIMFKRIGIEPIVRAQMTSSERFQQLPAEQQEQQIEMGAKFGRISMFVFPALAPIVMTLIIAGILLMVVNFLFGAEVRYKQMMAVTAYGSVPAIIATIIGGIILMLKSVDDIDLQHLENLVTSNLGPLVDPTAHKALNRLLVSIDLFSFWQIALLACGISAATKFKFGKSVTAVCIPWALYVLVVVGIKAIF